MQIRGDHGSCIFKRRLAMHVAHDPVLENKRDRDGDASQQPLQGQRKWLASSRWAAAAQFALGVSLTSSHNDLQILEIENDGSILKRTKDAVVTLRNVLEGKHDKEIAESLEEHNISRDGWLSSLYRMGLR
ncbi:unnamed protein product [Brassica oleracea]